MTLLAIIGGKLQGMEAAYLASKAGIRTVVIDKRPTSPALAFADEAVVIDVVREPEKAARILDDCDAVLPANENLETLTALVDMQRDYGLPLIFDMDVYSISSSKARSNEFMEREGVPLPRPWPECGFPVVVKPSEGSGSHGVTRAIDETQLGLGKERVRSLCPEVVVQEFLEGPSVSIEVIANGTEAVPLVTTEIFLDDVYDCKMVGSPWEGADEAVVDTIAEAGRSMAKGLGLKGIMDVEAIVSNGVPRILEIDARLPSQTPTAVLHSHGINMVKMLVDMEVHDHLEEPSLDAHKFAFFEHIAVDDGVMKSCGEASFAEVCFPRIISGLFGSDEMLTDYEPGRSHWRATIINTGNTVTAAWKRRKNVLQAIIDKEGITSYIDPEPEGYQ